MNSVIRWKSASDVVRNRPPLLPTTGVQPLSSSSLEQRYDTPWTPSLTSYWTSVQAARSTLPWVTLVLVFNWGEETLSLHEEPCITLVLDGVSGLGCALIGDGVDSDTGETMVSVLEKCSNFITIVNEMCALQSTVLCPPTNCCYTCNTPLVKHHDCIVRVYSTEGVSKAKKITLEGWGFAVRNVHSYTTMHSMETKMT